MKCSGMVVISLSRAVRIDSVGRWLRGLEHTQHPFSDICANRLQSSDEVSQKACGVVIPFVQRQPGNRLPNTCPSELASRASVAGGARDRQSIR